MSREALADGTQSQVVGRGLVLRLGVAALLLVAVLLAAYVMQGSNPGGDALAPNQRQSGAETMRHITEAQALQPEPARPTANPEPDPTPGVGSVPDPAQVVPKPTRSIGPATQAQIRAREPDTGAPAEPRSSAAAQTQLAITESKDKAPGMTKPVRGPRLQAGVFMQAANAQELKAQLEAQGLPVYIESRVQVGPFKDRKEAERARDALEAQGVTTLLIAQ